MSLPDKDYPFATVIDGESFLTKARWQIKKVHKFNWIALAIYLAAALAIWADSH